MKPELPIFSLLFVDDEPSILTLLQKTFAGENYDLHIALDGEEALAVMAGTRIDAALIDLKMPDMDGLSLLKKIKKSHQDVQVSILTGCGGIKDAVNAIKLGAVDFLEKPFSPEGLRARIAQLHKIWHLKEENTSLKAKMQTHFHFDPLVGNCTTMLEMKELIARVGPSNFTILIQGETGTGKELVARAIHAHSPRAGYNFVPVDCAAISETVMESELFGHAKGAFTGAHISTLGLIRSADKGTLFLDEVGELSPAIQAKLLRTIQEKEVRPVGSSKNYPVDIRILAATNRKLAEEVSLGNFREDLYYRLNVLAISVPPLRDLKEDIPLLTGHFLKLFSPDPSSVTAFSGEASACMQNHDWPGNIRELENVIRRIVALKNGDTVFPEDLPPAIYPLPVARPSGTDSIPAEDSLVAYETAAIRNALTKSGNNRKLAAGILGIGEATLYRKIKKYGILINRAYPYQND